MRLRVIYRKEGRGWRMTSAWWPLKPDLNLVPFEQVRRLVKGAEKVFERKINERTVEREFEVNP